MKLTFERAHELLDYDPTTGVFRWKIKRRGPRRPGEVAGTVGSHGYIAIVIDGEGWLGHRLAWFMTHGSLLDDQIDHENLIRVDNRLKNLRVATPLQNRGNVRVRSDSRTGVKGVSWHKQTQKWNAHIRINGRKRSLGLFHSILEAGAAYATAAQQHFGEYARVA